MSLVSSAENRPTHSSRLVEGQIAGSGRIVAHPEVTPFWSYFLVGGQPPRTLEFAFKILD
jgi:hypothetical protein